MGILDKIKAIEDEIDRTQKNKATNHHIGLLKGRLAKLRSQLLEIQTKGKVTKGEGFEAKKSGDARVALIGFPSVGKSTLLNHVTNTESETASYEYTTLTCIPGVLEINGSKIQILDLPGIIEGASKGVGRGKQVISIARTADLIIVMCDASKARIHKRLLVKELENAGIRLNKPRPNIYFNLRNNKDTKNRGVGYTTTVKQTKGVTEKLFKEICKQRKIHNCDVVLKKDATVDEIIDVVEDNRVYKKCLFIYNKIDNVTIEEVDRLAREESSFVLSLELKLNIKNLKYKIWETLDLIRVYSKKKGRGTDLKIPFIIPSGSTVEYVCKIIHKDMVDKFKFAMVWGTSVKFDTGQNVGLSHVFEDEDVVQIFHVN